MDRITQKLYEEKSVDGVNLFTHLQKLIQKVTKEPNQYTQNLEFFELISDFVKKNSFKYKQPMRDADVNRIHHQPGELNEFIKKCQKLFNDSKRNQKNCNILFPNFQSDATMMEWTGISFGEEEVLQISKSIRLLAEQQNAKELRFWGKILCSGKDYYVAEAITSPLNADEVPQNAEVKGEGANTYSYYVCQDILGEWFELPLITPEQITRAREIKYIFTGDLNAQIHSYPPYPGKEKHLLKAQIVRISTATVLAPKGLYRANEENQKIIEFEEEAFKISQDFGELKTLDYWVHLQPALLGIGRCSHWADPKLNEEEKEAKLAELSEKDPEIERLRGIGEEKSPYWKEGDEEEQPNWIVREYGDSQQYNMIGKEEGNVGCYAVAALKNLTWPGANLICSTRGWANIYVGYGNKVNQSPFTPVWPEKVQDEGEDQVEYREPNPDKPIVEVPEGQDGENPEGEGEGEGDGDDQ